MLSHRSIVLVPVALLLSTAPVMASVATPTSGTLLELTVGESTSIKLKNAGGCTFDFTAQVADIEVLTLSSGPLTGVTGGSINIIAKKPGSTTVTIQSQNGTCPPATHIYPVTVSPDFKLLSKSYAALTKDAAADVKFEIKAGFGLYKSDLKFLGTEYKNGALDDDGLHDGFHDAADTLRRSIFGAGLDAYASVISGGSMLLADNGLVFGEAPTEFFAGGCGSYDAFQDSVCSGFAKYHDTFDKESKKGVKSFAKLGGPLFGQWSVLPPLFAGGPVYPNQLGSIVTPQPLMGPLTITTKPAGSPGGTDGRLRVSGMGDSARTGQLDVTLTRQLDGGMPWITTLTPDIVDNEWTATFTDLEEGAYSLDTRYAGDSYGVTLQLNIGYSF